MSYNVFTGGWSCLSVDACWLIRVVVAKDMAVTIAYQNIEICFTDWLILSQIISLEKVILFDSTLLTVVLLSKLESVLSYPFIYLFFFQNWSQSSHILSFTCQLSSCNILNPLLPFQQSSQHFTRNRFYLKKPLSLYIRSNSLSINILS